MTILITATLDEKLASRNGNRLVYIFSVSNSHTIGHLMNRLRRKIKGILPGEGLYLMVNNTMPPVSSQVGALAKNEKLNVKLMCESVFGAWNKSFVRAEIEQSDVGCFIARVYYNWYFIFPWSEEGIFKTLEEAKAFILEKRTNGIMRYINTVS